jgi:hypothetical protein
VNDKLAIARTAADNLRIEAQIGCQEYVGLDDREDGLVVGLLDRLRASNVNNPGSLAQIDAWERAWRAADNAADSATARLGREVLAIADELRTRLTPKAATAGQAG